MSFSNPFFTDSGYMEKKKKKFDRTFKIIVIVQILAVAISIMIISYGITKIGQNIQEAGGLGKTIGRFLQDIKNP